MAWQNIGDITPILRQALVTTLCSTCSDLLSTNLLQMKANGDDSFTDRTFYLNDSLCPAWVSVKQSSVFTTRTCHMYFLFLFHHRPLQSMTIIIWRAMECTLFQFILRKLHFCIFSWCKYPASSELDGTAGWKPQYTEISAIRCHYHFRDNSIAFNNKYVWANF